MNKTSSNLLQNDQPHSKSPNPKINVSNIMNSTFTNLTLNQKDQNKSTKMKNELPNVYLYKNTQNYQAYTNKQRQKESSLLNRSIQQHNETSQLGLLNINKTMLNLNSNMNNVTMGSCSSYVVNSQNNNGKQMNLNNDENGKQKYQRKILKCVLNTKREEEWKLYMTKSQLIENKSNEMGEIQEYLLRFIWRVISRTSSGSYDQQNIANDQNLSQTVNTLNDKTRTSNNPQHLQTSLKKLKQQINTKKSHNDTLSNQQQSDQNSKSSSLTLHKNSQKESEFLMGIIRKKDEQIAQYIFEKGLMEKKGQLMLGKISELEQKVAEFMNEHNSRNFNLLDEDVAEGTQAKGEEERAKAFPVRANGSQVERSSLPHTKQDFIKMMLDSNKFKKQLEMKKIQNESLLNEIFRMKEKKDNLENEIELLKERNEQVQEQNMKVKELERYRQLWLMQSEESNTWRDLYYTKNIENLKAMNKIKILKEKNKQLLHSFNFSMVVNPDQEEDKLELENIIRSFQEWLKIISVPRVNYNGSGINPQEFIERLNRNNQHTNDQGYVNNGQNNVPLNKVSGEAIEYLPDPQNINYKLLKPNFFIFFEAYEKTILMEKNILNTRPLEPTFYVKIRAILDSMYNHFNTYSNSYKNWANFPEFVMGFLEKYEVSFTTYKLQPRSKPMPSEEKLTFLMNLFNKKLSNTWQCEVFRSFMLQEYTLDEIYYFLDCRNQINGGMVLMHGFGKADPISYVKLSHALSTVQKKLLPYDNQIIEKVKNILINRKKQKSEQFFIDRYFVLKLLLQVYALEKNKSLKIFELSFNKSKTKKVNVTYLDFYNFMSKNFDFLTSIQICELYRESYSLSSGKISYKTIHYLCTSKGLFIPLIWSKRLSMNVFEKSLSNDMLLLDLQNTARKMNFHLNECGVQTLGRIENDISFFVRQLDWYRNNRQFFYLKLNEQKMKISQASGMLNWINCTYNPNQMLTSQQIRQSIIQLHELVHRNDNVLKRLSQKKQEKQQAIKLITKNFKIRIQQSIEEFKKIDDEQIKKLREHIEMDLRMKEFRAKITGTGNKTVLKNGENKENFNKEVKNNTQKNLVKFQGEQDQDENNNEKKNQIREK